MPLLSGDERGVVVVRDPRAEHRRARPVLVESVTTAELFGAWTRFTRLALAEGIGTPAPVLGDLVGREGAL